jgi:DNA primase
VIPDDVKQRIREAASIREVIGQHVQLRRAGRSWKGLCPFHGEKTPSFNVHEDKRFFHCFGCGKHGDVFTFVMEMEGKSFIEAAEQLASRYGIELPKFEESPELRRQRSERAEMLDINRLVATFYREQLAGSRGEGARGYLDKRGIGADIAEKFQLGYAPAEWSVLTEYLRGQRGVNLDTAVKLGLIRPRSQSAGFYDLFRDRIVCPVIAPGGEVVGFSARVVGKPPPTPDGHEPPKYVNSTESAVYKKSKLLFGLHQARAAIQTAKRCVLVEGNFDVISLHQAGFCEVIAPLGTALTPEQVQILRRVAERVVLLYDGDKAGYLATMKALSVCVEAEVEVLVASRPGSKSSGGAGPLSDGVDPDALVSGGGAAQLREAVDRAQGGIEFFCFEVWGKARGNSDARARALEEAARLIVKVANPTKRDLIVDTLAKALGVEVGVVRQAVARASGQGPRGGGPGLSPPPASPTNQAPPPTDEVELLTLLVDHPSLATTSEAHKAFSLLTDTRLQAMYSAARAGNSLLELAPVQLPTNTAKDVLSGKYAKVADPAAVLAQMIVGLEVRRAQYEKARMREELAQLQRTGGGGGGANRARVDELGQRGREIQSNRKQDD